MSDKDITKVIYGDYTFISYPGGTTLSIHNKELRSGKSCNQLFTMRQTNSKGEKKRLKILHATLQMEKRKRKEIQIQHTQSIVKKFETIRRCRVIEESRKNNKEARGINLIGMSLKMAVSYLEFAIFNRKYFVGSILTLDSHLLVDNYLREINSYKYKD